MRPLWLLLAVAACQPSNPPARPSPLTRPIEISALIGGWRWQWRTSEAGTTRVETETWRLLPSPGTPTQLTGRYLRDVEVRSDDRVPFACNQRPWYRQRAIIDVVLDPTKTGFALRETDYHAEPSPCDHGFRHLGGYTAELRGGRLTLHWDGGTQTLWQVDSVAAPVAEAPWPTTPALTGPWRWDATSYDAAGNLRDESEWWELTRRDDTRIDATYRRRVTVRSPDGSILACAGAPSWSFDDAYVLDGQREEEHWHFYERAADPGVHPCLQATPKRTLDEATAEQIGDFLVLEWRGKRHQVLYRPEDDHPGDDRR